MGATPGDPCCICASCDPSITAISRPLSFSVNLQTSVFMHGGMCTSQSFEIATSDLYLAYFIPQGDLWMLYCAHGTELTDHQEHFHQIELCLTIPDIKYSDSQSLNQYQLLSHFNKVPPKDCYSGGHGGHIDTPPMH